MRAGDQQLVQFIEQRGVVGGGAGVLTLVLLPGSDQKRLQIAARLLLIFEQPPFDAASALPEVPEPVGVGEERRLRPGSDVVAGGDQHGADGAVR